MRFARALLKGSMAIAMMWGMASAQSARVLTRGDVKPIVLSPPRPNQWRVTPVWSGHVLLSMIVNDTPEPVLHAITADAFGEEIRFSIPKWPRLTVASLWGGEDGEIAAGGFGIDDKGDPSGFVVRIGRDRSKRTIIPVDNLLVHVMTIGPSGVIWAIGRGKDIETDEMHENILARLSPTGKSLGARMLNYPGVGPKEDLASGSQLRPSVDRVAWLTSTNNYIEFAADGTEMTHIGGPPNESNLDLASQTFALSYANTPLISKTARPKRSREPKLNIWTLDRVKNQWFLSEPASGAFPLYTNLYGFDGETLMTSGTDRTLGQVLVRYSLSETK